MLDEIFYHASYNTCVLRNLVRSEFYTFSPVRSVWSGRKNIHNRLQLVKCEFQLAFWTQLAPFLAPAPVQPTRDECLRLTRLIKNKLFTPAVNHHLTFTTRTSISAGVMSSSVNSEGYLANSGDNVEEIVDNMQR